MTIASYRIQLFKNLFYYLILTILYNENQVKWIAFFVSSSLINLIRKLDIFFIVLFNLVSTFFFSATDTSTSNSYITTVRGCESSDFCVKIPRDITEPNKMTKSIHCQICNSDLCNTSDCGRFQFGINIIVEVFFLLLLKFNI